MENNFNPQNPYKKPEPTGEKVYVSPVVTQSPTPAVAVPPEVISEEQTEIKSLKRKMLGIGLVFLIAFALMQLWSFPFIIIAQFLGFSYESVMALFDNEIFTNTAHIISSSFTFTVPFIVLAKIFKTRVSDLVPLGPAKKGTALPFFFFGMSMCALANLLANTGTNTLNSILSGFGLKYELPSSDGEKNLLIFALAFLSSAVVPALVEEFSCRGVTLGLLKGHSEGVAIVVSAVIFAVIHGNFVQIPFAFVVGLALAVIRIKTGTLWIAILVHFCNNFVSVLFEYALYNLPEGLQNVLFFIYLMNCMLLGVLGVVLIAKKSPETFSLNLNKNGISDKKLIRVSLTRPIIIALMAIYLLLALTFIKQI